MLYSNHERSAFVLIYLFLSVLAGITKGFFGKKTSGVISGFKDAVLANTLRMAFCLIFGTLVILLSGDFGNIIPPSNIIPAIILSGLANAIFVATWLVSVKNGAYMMLDVALMLATLVPTRLCHFVFSEPITLFQWIGIGVLLCATAVMCSYNNSLKSAINLKFAITLMVCALSSGFADFSQKMFVHQKASTPASVFNLYTYLVAGIFLIIFFGFIKGDCKPKQVLSKTYLFLLVMSACLFLNTWLKTIAAESLDSAVLYPLYQGSALVLASIMSVVCFKEKLNTKAYIGLALAFAGLIIMKI